MNDTGLSLKGPAMRSSGAATGIPTTMPACSMSTTTTPPIATTMSVSVDPSNTHLDAGHAATEGIFLVESVPQDPAKARRKAKPKTAAEPTGTAVESGIRKKKGYPPYREDVYVAYFAVIKHLKIYDDCVEPDPFNTGGSRDTEKGAQLHWAIYEALNERF